MSDAPPEYLRSGELLARDDSRLLIVDVQERFMPTIPVADQLVANCRKLLAGAKALGIPASATEQYPKGLGPTVPQLAEFLPTRPEKLRFSSAEVLGWTSASDDERHKVVVAGIETHVCIQQTVLDLLAAGYQVYVPADAVASRHKPDWRFALQRLRDSGAVVTSTEAVLFEWCEVAGTDEFKQISRIVTGR
jgi:nicotinamidase-related amidase